jgi:hypothetical protein
MYGGANFSRSWMLGEEEEEGQKGRWRIQPWLSSIWLGGPSGWQ